MNKILIITTLLGISFAFASCNGSLSVNSIKESDLLASESSTAVEGNIVYYSRNGFEPKEIIVGVGDKLTIINNSSEKMLVASDPHPGDNAYLPLNSSGPIYPKSSFNISFDTNGEYGYHDEYNTSQIGKIIVK